MEYPPETTAPFSSADDLGKALKIIIYILVGGTCFLASFVAYMYIFFLPASPNVDTQDFTDVDFAVVYADPIPTFNLSEESVVMTDKTEGDLDIKIEDDVVYGFGYISTDGIKWKQVALKPGKNSVFSEEDNWMTKEADYELLIDPTDLNVTSYPQTVKGYIAVYSCSRGNMGLWDCHGGWQIQSFDSVVVKDQNANADTCGCGDGYVCLHERCIREESVSGKAKVSAGESLSVVIDGQEYLATVTSIGGNGLTADVSVNGEKFKVDESVNDVYFIKGNLRFLVNRIVPFTSDEDGYLEIIVVSEYDDIALCENCIYSPQMSSGGSSGGTSGGSSSGSSVSTCTPSCAGRQCGSDGCTGSCGTCQTGQHCDNHQCVDDQCQPDCSIEGGGTKECGDDGCGGTCPPGCDTGEKCSDGLCINETICDENWGDCDGNVSNGCETELTTDTDCGSCGNTCSASECCADHTCTPADCSQQHCGLDTVCGIIDCGDCSEYGTGYTCKGILCLPPPPS